MYIKNQTAFAGSYHFIQKQKGLPCAYCGKPILTHAQIKEIHRSLEGKKGEEIAQILEPYVDIIQGKGRKFLTEIVYFSKLPQFRDWKFKQLTMLGTEEKIYNENSYNTLENILHSISFSVEHATARTNDGKNIYSNYLPMHVHCNESRSDINYAQIAILNPDFVNNIRKSLLEIKSRVYSDKNGFTNYKINLNEDYFDGIKENIEKQGLSKDFFADI